MEEEVIRVKMPRNGEMFARITEMLGSSRFRANCADGKERIIRIPGKMRRRAWVRPNDIIIIKPWDIQGNERGDLVWKFSPTQMDYLRKQGHAKDL